MANQFGRDDMNALLGGSSEEMAAFRPATVAPGRDVKKKPNSTDVPDISKMTAAETASLLLERKKAVRSNNTVRYRTNRTLAHHELANELSTAIEVQQLPVQESQHEGDDSGGDEEFAAPTAGERQRRAPQVLHSKAKPKVLKRQDRRKYDSSSSDGERSSRRQRRTRRRDGSVSSSSSDEEDQRRLRRQKARQRLDESLVLVPRVQPKEASMENVGVGKDPPKDTVTAPATASVTKPQVQKIRTESSGSGSGSFCSSSASSSSDDSSSEEDEQVLAKPVFVPKSKRRLIPSQERKSEVEEARLAREKQLGEKRKIQSRALVAQQIAHSESSTMVDEGLDEEFGGATNPPPHDDDGVDAEKERCAWEMRELERLLVAMDQENARALAEREYHRRRLMTDEECMKEDITTGRYQAPGYKADIPKPERGVQRFYHRGAYYMDEEEWDEADVRHKAAEYAKAATGEDKIDKTQLPEIMQVKKFGFARQNHRYKGLAMEDTTDKTMDILPIVRKRKGTS